MSRLNEPVSWAKSRAVTNRDAVESGTHRVTLAKGLAYHLGACWFADKLPAVDPLPPAPKLLKAGVPAGLYFRVIYNSSWCSLIPRSGNYVRIWTGGCCPAAAAAVR